MSTRIDLFDEEGRPTARVTLATMEPGLRTHKQASLRVAIAQSLPVEMWETTREIIGVQSDAPRKGYATALLHQVCAEADRARIVLFLQVRPFAEGMSEEQLTKFYARFGFTVIQAEPCLMSRVPQRSAIARAA